jgi:hypothetical protein
MISNKIADRRLVFSIKANKYIVNKGIRKLIHLRWKRYWSLNFICIFIEQQDLID